MEIAKAKNSNPVSDLSEMEVVAETREDGTVSFIVDLRFGVSELELLGRTYEVTAKQATLRLTCEGVEVETGSRHGEYVRPGRVTSTVSRQTKIADAAKASASGKMTVDPSSLVPASGSVSVEGSASTSSETTVAIENQTSSEVLRIEAMGGNRWQIREPEGDRLLRGKYLQREQLCILADAGRANRHRVEAVVHVKQKDLHVTPNPDRIRLLGGANRNRDALFAILVAKTIHENFDDTAAYAGTLRSSACVCDSDD